MKKEPSSLGCTRRGFLGVLGALGALLPWWPRMIDPRRRLSGREAAYYRKGRHIR